jgi:hypothetical protein
MRPLSGRHSSLRCGESIAMTSESTTVTYLAYWHRGIISSEESVEPVKVRDPQQHANNAPNSAFAFFYYDIITSTVDVDGEHIDTSTGRHNVTPTYFINARAMTYDEVAALPSNNSILLSNMRGNRWDRVVRCRTGNITPVEEGEYELITTS